MRYIGSKALMLDNILNVIRKEAKDVKTITDIFAGTGLVSHFLKDNGYSVFANDQLYFAYVLNKGTLEMNTPLSPQIHELIHHLNQLTVKNSPWFDTDSAFIYQNYSSHDKCQRMYFQRENALKIDLIRQEIERLSDEISRKEYFYLLSLLLHAVPSISNITGTYGAYLKYWDARTYKPLTLKEVEISQNNIACQCFNQNATDLAHQIENDLVYLDPPYNGRQYISNYHLLETIAKYDYPKIKGVTGIRVDSEKASDFCKKGKVEAAFSELFDALQCRYLLVSYNNEGLLSTKQMSQLLKRVGKPETFRLFEYDYRRYKNKIPNNTAGLKEQLYFIEKN